MQARPEVLIIGLLWALSAGWLGWAAPASAAGASVTADAAESRARLSTGLSEVNLEAFDRLQVPRWGRDPFATPTKQEAMAGTLSLTAILYHQSSSVAVLNGQVVRVGDEVDGRQVVSIDRDHVMVREGKLLRRLDVPRFTAVKGKP
jgi:hypothetical protein